MFETRSNVNAALIAIVHDFSIERTIPVNSHILFHDECSMTFGMFSNEARPSEMDGYIARLRLALSSGFMDLTGVNGMKELHFFDPRSEYSILERRLRLNRSDQCTEICTSDGARVVSRNIPSDQIHFPAFVLCDSMTESPFVIPVNGDETVVACPIFDSEEQCRFFGGGAPVPLVMLTFDTPLGLYDYAVAIQQETEAECVLLSTEANADTGLEFKGVISIDDFLSRLREASTR